MLTWLSELWAVLVDAKQEGDLWGHLAAWWAVVRGRVDPEACYRLAGHD